MHRLTSAVFLLLSTTSTFAQAQDQSDPRNSQEGSTERSDIVVTGIRKSLADALAVKRQSAQVVDVISAEDVGKFPDKNIGEALQRVTGVQITRGGGEGQAITIRGADPRSTGSRSTASRLCRHRSPPPPAMAATARSISATCPQSSSRASKCSNRPRPT
ncbi:TonB-dependent receptor plug domain-containing protein [Sphingobium scionense]